MNGGGRSNLQPPNVSNYPPARTTLPPPLTPLIPGEYSWFGLWGVVYDFGPFNAYRAWDYRQDHPLDLEALLGYEPAWDLIDSYDSRPDRWIAEPQCQIGQC